MFARVRVWDEIVLPTKYILYISRSKTSHYSHTKRPGEAQRIYM